jgi:hypothetical protein
LRLSERGARLLHELRRLLRLPAVDGPDGAAARPDGPPAGGEASFSGGVGGVEILSGRFDEREQLVGSATTPA